MVEIIVKQHLVHVTCDSEFATFTRQPEETKGLQQITFSFTPNGRMADKIEASGIAEVVSYNGNGTMLFKRKPFYETHLFIDVIADVLTSYQLQNHV